MGRLFGTDGVRGIAGEDLTAQLAHRLGNAAAAVLTDAGNPAKKPLVLIGQDTRISGDMLACAMAAGLCETGCNVTMLGVVPTPAVAYLVRRLGADAGVMISASHNPSEYNGIKIFDANGYKLPDETEDRIEAILRGKSQVRFAVGAHIGTIVPPKANPLALYCEHVKCLLPKKGTDCPRRILMDLANGSAAATARFIFTPEAMAPDTVTFCADHPDGVNINDNCGSTKLKNLAAAVVRGGYDLGIAFDGDADRCLAVDECGREIDGDKMIARLALTMKEKGNLPHNTAVVTKLSNLGFHQMAQREGITVKVTEVGDRYVLEEMLRGGYGIGGEQSGHIILLAYGTTGDGQVSATQVLSALRDAPGKRASEVFGCMRSLPQVAINVQVPNEKKADIMADETVLSELEQVRQALSETGRVLLRPSGTEALIRIMLEGTDEGELTALGQRIAEKIAQKLCGQN